jgi:poly-gamma-glutamate synthesis protein (capsule biosynthesis protein)
MAQPRTLAFLGDVMLGRTVSGNPGHHAPEWFWGDVLPILRQADAAIANLEAPLTTSDDRWRRSWKMFHFRADPASVRILECGNVRFVCLANNHALDFGERGLLDTMQTLDAAGIRHAGAGRNAAEAAGTALLDLPGLKIGFIAATDTMRPFAAGADRPGTHVMEMVDEPDQLGWIERSVAAMRRDGAGLRVLSLHWGANLRAAPSRRFRRFAHAAIERGIDVIHGHSAHLAQAVERHKGGLILYGAGNSIDDSWKIPFRPTTASFVFVLEMAGGRPARLRMLPVRIRSAALGRATGAEAAALKKRMTALCADLGTTVVETDDGLEIPL